mgnify:CR=1 FL=1
MNRIALITGGSRGLGRSMALALAGKGIDVVITYHSQEAEAAKVVAAIEAQGRKGAALQLDVGDSKRFPAFVETLQATLIKRFGAQKLNILVNNAGTGLSAPFAQTTEEKFDQLVNEHLKAPYFLTQRLLPVLEDGARILNVSSGLARMTLPGSSAYGALKAAVETLTRYQAKELGARKMTVNVVAPGAVATDFNGGHVRDNAQLQAMLLPGIALGRIGMPEDIGPAVAALVSEELAWMTAQRIELSGGQNL